MPSGSWQGPCRERPEGFFSSTSQVTPRATSRRKHHFHELRSAELEAGNLTFVECANLGVQRRAIG